jgi:hypothetical protein
MAACIICGEPVPEPEAGEPYCGDCLDDLIPDDVKAMKPWGSLPTAQEVSRQ